MVTITISSNGISEQIARLQDKFIPAKFLPALEVKLRLLMTNHLTDTYATKPNRLGAPSTGYWKEAIDSISTEVNVANYSVRLDITQRGVALHYYGGTVVPKGSSEVTGRPIKRLSIPVTPEAHGKRIAQIPELTFGKFAEGFGIGKDNHRWFILVKKVTIKPDRNIIPADLEQELTTWFVAQLPSV